MIESEVGGKARVKAGFEARKIVGEGVGVLPPLVRALGRPVAS